MYQNRVTAFIDILGFRNIVSQTVDNDELCEKIFKVLHAMTSENISNGLFGAITPDVPADQLAEVLEVTKLFSQALKGQSSIQVTHFSDSIVISVGMDNDMNVMSVFEFLGKLIYQLWHEFNILIRGAVTTGKLIHEENGALFGPAMVGAYDLETNLAKHPRIIIDEFTSDCIKKSISYKQMSKLFKELNEEKETKGGNILKIENGLEISLATSLNHFLNNHFSFNKAMKQEMETVLKNANDDLNKLKGETTREDVKEKYDYLINEIKLIKG